MTPDIKTVLLFPGEGEITLRALWVLRVAGFSATTISWREAAFLYDASPAPQTMALEEAKRAEDAINHILHYEYGCEQTNITPTVQSVERR